MLVRFSLTLVKEWTPPPRSLRIVKVLARLARLMRVARVGKLISRVKAFEQC